MEDAGDCVAPIPTEGEVKPDGDAAVNDADVADAGCKAIPLASENLLTRTSEADDGDVRFLLALFGSRDSSIVGPWPAVSGNSELLIT